MTANILAKIYQATDGKELNRLRREIIPVALITNAAQDLCLQSVDLRFAQLNAQAGYAETKNQTPMIVRTA